MNKIKSVAIALICLMALSSIMLFSNASATVTTFGQTAKGSGIAWQPATVMVASRFTPTENGVAQSISVNVYNPSVSYSNYVKCAIYRESDHRLIATTEQKTIPLGFNGWQKFNIDSGPSLSSGTSYSLVVWFSNTGNHIFYTSGNTRQSWYGFSSYGNFPSTYSSVLVGQENNVYSIYCSLASTTQSSPSSTSTPSTPSTQTYVGTNLVPVPTGWWIDRTGQHLDYSVTYNGQPSIRLDPTTYYTNNPARECISKCIAIHPGDHVVFTCWVKITGSGYGDTNPYSGARIGIDFYDNYGRITAIQSDGQHGYYPNENAQAQLDHYVHWGTEGWVQRTITFTVPQSMLSDGGYLGPSHVAGQYYTPTCMFLWMQVWGSYGPTDPGQAWFANPTLNIY